MKSFKTIAAAVLLAGAAAFAVSAANPVKVACVGNSITYGTGVENREVNSYPVQLGRLLGDKYEVGSFGKPGATLLTKGHNPYIKTQEFAGALAFRPDIVVIHLGVNDTDPRNWPDYGDFFVKEYLALVDSFKAVNPQVRVIIANLTPLSAKHYRFKSGTREWRDLERAAIVDIAKVADAELIDFGDDMRDRQNLMLDGVHPNAKGATILANSVYSAITGNYGGLKMPPVYGSGMVLQRYKPLNISGTANAGANVTVTLAGTKVKAVANNRGQWAVTLPPMAETTGLTMTVSDGKQTLKYTDVAVGEVWLASGQSNMEFHLDWCKTYKQDTALMNDPMLRLFDMKPRVVTNNITWNEADLDSLDALKYYLPSSWQKSTPSTAAPFSAIAWYFGKMLRDSLQVPVGIISNAIGGSTTESWIDIETLEHGLPEALVDWRRNDYVQKWAQGRANKNTGDDMTRRHPYEPTFLFASGVRPLAAYPIAGVIWYQGESNAHNIEVHEALFRMLVQSWRSTWGEPQLPFIFTQLSSINRPSWPLFRDSQRRLALEIPGTAMAVSSDHGDSLDVHPKNKRPIGERLARQALNRVYSMGNVTPSGPLPVSATVVAPGVVELTLDYAEGLKTSDGHSPRTFEVAETDGLYYPATAQITPDNKIRLTNMDITNPRYVRYAWQPFTRANLVNGDNLPASTFKLAVNEAPDSEEGIKSGVSACFGGLADGRILRAGGCNFPSNPMAPGSQKKFYRSIYALDVTPEGVNTTVVGMLPEPMAYGASASTPKGLVAVGGTNTSAALATAYLISGNGTVAELPSLPVTIDNTAACYADGKVYVAGGNVNGTPSNALYCLDLDNTAAGWKQLKSFPGNPRVQPVLGASKDAKGKTMLYMWGGFAGKGEGREASLNTDGLMYNPASGKWSALPSPVDTKGETVSTGGGTAVTLPDGRIVVTGGVNKDVFLEALRNQAPDYLSHPIEWYRFNDLVLVFNPTTSSWSIADTDPEAARAGAVSTLSPDGKSVILIGGELKPRIRTEKVAEIKF